MSRKRGERKREELRRAAYQCFREKGYHGTTVEAICSATSTSKGSFYWHYDSKQAIFIDVLETWTRTVMDELYEQFEEAVGSDDYVASITAALARESRRGRHMVPLWSEFVSLSHREPEIREAVAKFHHRARIAIASILRPTVGPAMSEEELQAMGATAFGAYLGLMMQHVVEPEQANTPETVGPFLTMLGRIIKAVPDAAIAAARRRRDAAPTPESGN